MNIRIILPMILLSLPYAACAENLNPTQTEIDAWVQADRNQDGMLTRAEFKTFVQAMAGTGQPTAKQINTFRAYGFAFFVTDANGDGVLAPEELRSADNDFRSTGTDTAH